MSFARHNLELTQELRDLDYDDARTEEVLYHHPAYGPDERAENVIQGFRDRLERNSRRRTEINELLDAAPTD